MDRTGPRVWRPSSLDAAVKLRREFGNDACLLAGGTLAQLGWATSVPMPRHLIDLTSLAGAGDLRGTSVSREGGLGIGALTTLSELRADAFIRENYPALYRSLGSIAGANVRNLATIGGNVAAATGCAIPALLALDAEIEIFDEGGPRRLPLWDAFAAGSVPFKEAILTAIFLPRVVDRMLSFSEKIGLRQSLSPSIIGVAASLTLDAAERIRMARFAVGGGATPPQRLTLAEAVVLERRIEDIDQAKLRHALVAEIRAPTDMFRTGLYRRHAAANTIVAGLGTEDTAAKAASSRPPVSVAADAGPDRQIQLTRAGLAGRWRARPDIDAKVNGDFAYLTDIRRPDMLVGRILRAGHPHARLISIDTAVAEALPGVHAVVTHRDVPGLNAYGIVIQDQPAFCADKVRYLGDVVAAVAAENDEIAARALALIRVEYETLPIVEDMEAALRPDAPPLHAGGNLLRELKFRRGDIETAWSRCVHIVEDVYTTPRQMHAFMETEGGYAMPGGDGGLIVGVAGQYGHRDRLQLARILGLDEARIRIVSSPSGGAFGGKDELTVQPALALLALRAGRPVRLQLDRSESVIAGVKRLPMRIRMRTGCDADGHLLAQEVELLADNGAYASLGPGVVETALEHACGSYRVPHVRTHGRVVYTNNGVCGAFRGFGANEMLFAVETQMARLAEKAGIDPAIFRRLNLRAPGDPGHFGQTIAPTDRSRETLAAAAANALWREVRGPASDGRWAFGVGLGIAMVGNGLGSAFPDFGGGRLSLASDGAIEAAFGLVEIGQGVVATIQEAVAAALGCERQDVRPVIGDTALAPDSGSTTASRGTQIVWQARQHLAPALRTEILAAAAARLGCPVAELSLGRGGIYASRRNFAEEPLLSFAALAASLDEAVLPAVSGTVDFPHAEGVAGNARFIFCQSAVVARVAVDRATGVVKVLNLDQHTAAGPVMDVAGYLGQIEGAGVQAVGFTLSENVLMQGGKVLTANLDSYMVPTIADAPASMRVFALEDLDPGDPYGPRGVGELGLGAVAPAIVAAVADAVGVWMTRMPIDPETLLAGMGGMPAREAR